MCAVLTLFAADEGLYQVLMPFIDFKNESFNWETIHSLPLSASGKAVCDWAYSIWRDEIPEGRNPFESALNLEVHFSRAILKALSIRWGLSK